ncbi:MULTISPECIES: DUF1656 domain-containing protein [Rhodanobacter]|uniref:DUF1656 domain-containing protein n=1 Tax=Rhodanobacter TaxID=75309 RepID=UPI0004040236|nr:MULTISPECIES: DUF1656 domain-containing protein [Rhodanobacter]TAN19215.1 MAG: DUF1656 domain-containing protein [Rhodanobacter sp.]UJJ53897.1 DUF1656 domain-containing protein [Rhodanobacter thiooxydans]
MPYEVSLGGIYFPGVLVLAVLLLPVLWLLDHLLGRIGLYRHATHPSLLRIALFAGVCSVATLAMFS